MGDIVDAIRSSMTSDLASFNTISHNIANVNTNGYRAKFTVYDGVESRSNVSNKQGSLMLTNTATDLAIQGVGYFVIKENDSYFATRLGKFEIGDNGHLTSTQGGVVMGDNGPITIDEGEFNVDNEGNITANGSLLDRVKVIELDLANKPESNGRISIDIDKANISDSYQLKQGFLESSNVNTPQEMINLMEIQKHFGLTQKYYSIYTRMMENSIKEIGK